MDVTPPATAKSRAPLAPAPIPQQQSTTKLPTVTPTVPVMDVTAAPAQSAPIETAAPTQANKTPALITNAKQPKPKGSTPTIAIIATVVIVLGVAAMAVYAYLKTQK